MSDNRTTRVVSGIASLFLAIAVFCWGTAYKLSLYAASSEPQIMATLLTEAERPARPSALGIKSPQTPAPVVAAFAAAHAVRPLTMARPSWRVVPMCAIEQLLRLFVATSDGSGLRAPPSR